MLQRPQVLAGAYLIVAGVLPAFSILLKKGGEDFLFAYAHLFLFPIFFGPILVLILVPVAHHVLCTPAILRRRKEAAILLVLLTLLVTVGDGFFGNHAIWEISDAVTTIEMYDHFEDPKATQAKGYADSINERIDSIGNWSLARYLYLVSLFVQTFVLLMFFLLLSLLKLFDPMDSAETNIKQSLIVRLGLGYPFCLTWLLLRLIYLFTEKYRLYLSENETFPIGNIIILVLFVLAFFYLVIMLWVKYSKVVEAVSTILPVSGLTAVTVAGFFVSENSFYLRDVSVLDYLFVLGALTLISAALYFRSEGKK